MSETETDPYDSVVQSAERDDISEQSVRQTSLNAVSFRVLKTLAAREGVFGKRKTASSYRKDLAEIGYFYGPVHDDTLYKRVNGETTYLKNDPT
jgi:hypothetical protein